MSFLTRLQKLRQSITEKELEAFLVSQPENRRYLSGFTGSEGFLVISPDKAILAVDFRYIEQAKQEAPDFEVIHLKGKIHEALSALILDLGFRRIGFEADYWTLASFQRLTQKAQKVELLSTESVVEALRVVKDEEEISQISKAAELADAAFEYIASEIHPGMTEKQAAWEIEKFLKEKGSETLPFEVIVASGANSALPHATPSDHVIEEGEPIIMDFGARIGGYCSDFTRTLCLGPSDDVFNKRYDLVLSAQLTALATLETEMTGKQADQLARTVIEQGGYGDAFGHGLGHGVGLAVHENPRLASTSEDSLLEKTVFTVEPGIYIPGWGGIRIEDTVVLHEGKAQPLTKATK